MLPPRLPIKSETIRPYDQRRFQIAGMGNHVKTSANKKFQSVELKIYRTVVTLLEKKIMELCIFGYEIKVTIDLLIALIALIVSAVSLGASIRFWRKSFRPIVTATVKTNDAGNKLIAYDLVLLNSGTIPAKNITINTDDTLLASALGSDATSENRRIWLACFAEDTIIPILHNGDRVSCSFGTTTENDKGFWKYKASIAIVIKYNGWFGLEYKQPQALKIVDSDSFTGFMWEKPDK